MRVLQRIRIVELVCFVQDSDLHDLIGVVFMDLGEVWAWKG